MNKIKYFAFLIISFFIFGISVKANDVNNIAGLRAKYASRDYFIEKYNVDIIVNEDNTFDITETIDAYFNVEKHGIIRKIPIKNKIIRNDGSSSTNRAKINNMSINENYNSYSENDYYSYRIGDENKYNKGEKEYILKYNYNIGNDPLKDIDELYLNIIGTEWDTIIGNATFKITMPKAFDSSKIGFSTGYKGLTNNNVIYNVNDNVITGYYNGILTNNEGITIRCELPQGYFVKQEVKPVNVLIYIIPSIMALIAYLLWFFFGKDEKVINQAEYFAPDNLNSLEVGYIYKGGAEKKDVISLLIYLANKKYLKIEETDDKNNSYKIIKLKEYAGNNEYEQIFMNGLFPGGTKETDSSTLKKEFYSTIDCILHNINKEKGKMFENKKSWLVIILFLIAYFSFFVLVKDIDNLFSYSFFFPPYFFAFYIIFNSKTGWFAKILVSLFFIVHCGLLTYDFWLLLIDNNLLIPFIYLLFIITEILIIYKYMPKRTKDSQEIYARVIAFRNFLNLSEKDILNSQVENNPNYFYDILPYTYVLGISNKWIKMFENINVEAPDWYSGSSDFSLNRVDDSFNSIYSDINSYYQTSSFSSDSGSDFSGGGSSGDGSGGGGGSSW